MSFCFNFDVPAQTPNEGDVDGNVQQNVKRDDPAKCVSNIIRELCIFCANTECMEWCGLLYEVGTVQERPLGSAP